MKLDNNEEDKKDNLWLSFVIDIIFAILLILGIFFCYKSIIRTNELISRSEEVYMNDVVITDIERYIDDDGVFRYYMEVSVPVYGKYTIDISKGEFIKYRVKETVDIKIKNSKAYIVEKDK